MTRCKKYEEKIKQVHERIWRVDIIKPSGFWDEKTAGVYFFSTEQEPPERGWHKHTSFGYFKARTYWGLLRRIKKVFEDCPPYNKLRMGTHMRLHPRVIKK